MWMCIKLSGVALHDIYSTLVDKSVHFSLRTEGDWRGAEQTHTRGADVFFSYFCIQMEALMKVFFFLHRRCFPSTSHNLNTVSHTVLPLSQMDHDPRNPTYISSQGPLPTTVADFWQVILTSIHCGLSSFTDFLLQRWGFGRTKTCLHYVCFFI